MIIQLHKSTNIHANLKYIAGKMDVKGNSIFMHANFDIKNNDIINSLKIEFARRDTLNIRTKKISFHASINPTHDELKRLDLKKVISEYMIHMGYANQPYLVVMHNDIDRVHFHIISHRIKEDGKKINSSNEIFKSHSYETRINNQIRQTTKQNIFDSRSEFRPQKFQLGNGNMKKQIQAIFSDACEYKYSSIFELQQILLDRNIELVEIDNKYIAAGLTSKGRKTRAVTVDSSLIKPQQRVAITLQQKERIRNIVKHSMNIGMNEFHILNILAKKGLSVKFLRSEDGHIYGTYIIDHKNKFILKASSISKEISASAWDDLARNKWREIKFLHNEKAEHIKYNCLSIFNLDFFLYNEQNNLKQTYRDLRYARQRKNSKRII